MSTGRMLGERSARVQNWRWRAKTGTAALEESVACIAIARFGLSPVAPLRLAQPKITCKLNSTQGLSVFPSLIT